MTLMTVRFTPNTSGTGKLADAELHFEGEGPLADLKLVGFAVWERRGGCGLNVTFPARQYSVNGERRSFALLRPVTDSSSADAIRELIIERYREYVAELEGGAVESDGFRWAPDTAATR